MSQRRINWSRGLAVAAFAAASANPVFSDVPVTYTDAGKSLFQITVPDFWTVRTGGMRELAAPGTEDIRQTSRVIGLQPTTEPRLWMGFVSPTGVRNFDEGLAYLQDIGPFLVMDAEVDSRKSQRVGGLPANSISGRGTRDGKSVNFTAVIVDLPNGRMAVAVVVMEAGIDPNAITDVNAIFASFRSVR